MIRHVGGYVSVFDPDRPLKERNTFTCIHCNRVVIVKPGETLSDYSWCRRCMKPVCNGKRCNDQCIPWEREMEIREARDRLRRKMDGALSL